MLFDQWQDGAPSASFTATIQPPADYNPGELFRRELPCLLAVLQRTNVTPGIVVVDAYVTLDPSGRPGLGAHLYEALGRRVPVIGVAKTPFAAATTAIPLLRGTSVKPLWITALGVQAEEAALHIGSMHGNHRMPTLLRQVDRLARTAPA